jgi:hypothetical protein
MRSHNTGLLHRILKTEHVLFLVRSAAHYIPSYAIQTARLPTPLGTIVQSYIPPVLPSLAASSSSSFLQASTSPFFHPLSVALRTLAILVSLKRDLRAVSGRVEEGKTPALV